MLREKKRKTRNLSAETRLKLSKANLGKIRSEETCIKLSDSHTDKTLYPFFHPRFGEEVCTRAFLYKKYSLNPSGIAQLIGGRINVHRGWKVKPYNKWSKE